jgi:hypothetical protein
MFWFDDDDFQRGDFMQISFSKKKEKKKTNQAISVVCKPCHNIL